MKKSFMILCMVLAVGSLTISSISCTQTDKKNGTIFMKTIESKRYPKIEYIPGEEILLSKDEMPFDFDVSETLTSDKNSMKLVLKALDNLEQMEESARDYLKSVILDTEHKEYELLHDILDYHLDENIFGSYDDIDKMIGVENARELSYTELLDYLSINRFGSGYDDEFGGQYFIMDLNFNPDYTDQLFVVYFDKDRNVISITIES